MKKILAMSITLLLVVASLASCTTTGNNPSQTTTKPTVTYANSSTDTTPSNITFTEVNELVYAKENLNVRSTPSSDIDTNKVGTLAQGQSVTRIGYNDSWSKVIFNGETCYVASKYLSTAAVTVTSSKDTDTAVPSGQFTECNEIVFAYPVDDNDKHIAKGEINAYASASRDDWAAKFSDGTQFTRTGIFVEDAKTGYGWSRVVASDGKTYYIRNSVLSTVDPNGKTTTAVTTTAAATTETKPVSGS